LALLAGTSLSLPACSAPATTASAPTASAASIPPLPQNEEELDAGTYLVTGFTVPFSITVPDGWSSFGWGVLKADAVEWKVFVNFQIPTSVPADACAWKGTFAEFEPTPEAFAGVMAAQTSTETSPPVPITMGDYAGVEYDYWIESGVDPLDCDTERLCLWATDGYSECTRGYEHPTERETDRVLDLNGEFALIAVGQFIDVDPALTAEARAVFDSITFDPPIP
jgi:hypothetical protein